MSDPYGRFEAFVDILRTSGGARMIVDQAKLMLVNAGIAVTEGFNNIMGTAETGFDKVFGPAGVLDKMVVAFSDIAFNLNSIPLIGSKEGRDSAKEFGREARIRVQAQDLVEASKGLVGVIIPTIDSFGRKVDEEYRNDLRTAAEKIMSNTDKGLQKDSESLLELKKQKFILETTIGVRSIFRTLGFESLEFQKQTAENTQALADKANEQTSTIPQFLDDTVSVLGASMEGILFGTPAAGLEAVVNALEFQTEVIESGQNQNPSRYADPGS